jgi:anti-anti-sigma regulatory factor
MIDIEPHGDVLLIQLDLGPFTVTDLILGTIRLEMLEIAQDADPPLMVVDLSPTHHLGATAVRILGDVWTTIRTRRGRIAFCELNAYNRQILQYMRLDQHWEIYKSRDEALRAVGHSLAAR